MRTLLRLLRRLPLHLPSQALCTFPWIRCRGKTPWTSALAPGTCPTAVTDASTILVTAAGDGVVAAGLSVTVVVNTSVAPRAGGTTTIDAPAPTWDATVPGLVGGDGGRQDAAWTGWNPSGKGYKGHDTSTMEITDFQEPGARLKPWLRELSSVFGDMTQVPLRTSMVSNCTRPCHLERWVESWQINFLSTTRV